MTTFFIIFMLVILGIALLITLVVKARGRGDKADENGFLNSDGDHIYYDRSLIEKKRFQREHPEAKEVRTFRRIFSGNK